MINITVSTGGLGRPSVDNDTWGGLFVEVDALPTGWTANEVKRIFSVEELEQYGIKEDAATEQLKLVYWHVSEVFRLQPDATLYLQLSLDATASYTEILTAFSQAENNLRQFAIVKYTTTLAASEAESLNTALETIFANEVQPARCILTLKKDIGDAIPDYSANDYYRVITDIANDITPSGLAKTIFDSAIGMCGAGGTHLGQMLRTKVHINPAYTKYPINSDGRWVLLGDINGDSVENLTNAEITAYKNQGVVLGIRQKRSVDAFISSNRTSGDISDDYAISNNGRTIDKASVLAYDGIFPYLSAPVYANPNTGQLTPETVLKFEESVYNSINTNMVLNRSGEDVELSIDPQTGNLNRNSVYIDPAQNVVSTGVLNVTVRLTPVGSADEININIGFEIPVTT